MKAHIVLIIMVLVVAARADGFLDRIKQFASSKAENFTTEENGASLVVPRNFFDLEWRETIVDKNRVGLLSKVISTTDLGTNKIERNVVFVELDENGELSTFDGKKMILSELVTILEKNRKSKNPTVVIEISGKSKPTIGLFAVILESRHRVAFIEKPEVK